MSTTTPSKGLLSKTILNCEGGGSGGDGDGGGDDGGGGGGGGGDDGGVPDGGGGGDIADRSVAEFAFQSFCFDKIGNVVAVVAPVLLDNVSSRAPNA